MTALMSDLSPSDVIAYAALGANLGDRAENLSSAMKLLDGTDGIRVLRASRFIENPSVGGPADSPPFLNAVAELRTRLPPAELLERFLQVERALGRVRGERWGPRVIDLDLILYGSQIIRSPALTIPHPRMHEREFVLAPLAEVAPGVVHPVLQKSAREMLAAFVAAASADR